MDNPPADPDPSSSDVSDTEETDIAERTDLPPQVQPKVDRLLQLRQRLHKSTEENRRQVYQEHQRTHENPSDQRRQARKRREAEILQQKEQHTGDYERSRFKDYSIEKVEAYEEKQAQRAENVERGFTDYSQVNRRKYDRDVAKLKPDLAAYQQRTEAGESHVPDPKNVERLVKSVEAQQKKRAALHKPSIEQEGEDVSYINERNARFNRKMNRAYDKYTKEIKDNLERGTAL
ncbi:pre-mRNA-splicing factor SYF2 [Coemansia sp. RSA 2671]|uniref:Pre-mRNA-splicing factor SYF2 n=1 Tax=Coemansia linderi TaxID=2663919 RepID=A0ACC1JSA6_9FUNG|nr:pre-mRNA-splicing factor SYF2 [Coemansia sp. RSA 2675]KAJ2347358.1 pre-mRNA-splicing factor SYF2 [Coemansia sp. RSA 2671]KAJ2766322.1 pre-mRNA-splicing factor SYF2 [Coemansia linderi]